MRYQESATSSAELLRLILPRVAKHGGSYVPTTYAVWYEYLAGVNPKLAAALEARLKESEKLLQADYEQLYAKYIDTRDLGALEQYQTGLGELLRRLADLAASSGEGAAQYAQALADCEQELRSTEDAEGLSRLVQSMLKSTTAVRETTEALQQEVAATREEVQQLRGQMGALQNLAQTDSLTRLRNRRGFEQSVAECAQGRDGALSGCSLMIADIDHFKKVNDNYGHLFGDQVICAAAQVLQSNVKGRDITGRWGGEEFVAFLPETGGAGAMAVAEQIRHAFSKVRIRRGGKHELTDAVTISIGVAEVIAGETLEQAVGRADAALYQCKESGRNCVRLAAAAASAELLAAAS